MAGSFKRYDDWVKDIRSSYRPFLTVNAVNKYSRRHQYFCHIQSRVIHLLSDGELYAYQGLIRAPGTTSVLEQYALDPERTVDIAEIMGIKHPANVKSGSPHIMSTDFVVSRCSKKTAYTFKYCKDLYLKNSKTVEPDPTKWRTWQKLAIENEFWKRQDIEYRIITERDFPKSQFYNLRRAEYAANLDFPEHICDEFVFNFMGLWLENPFQSLENIIKRCSQIVNINLKKCVDIFYRCVFSNKIRIDHSVIFQMHLPLNILIEAGKND